MNKKLIPILAALIVVAAGALYFLVLSPGGEEKAAVYTEYLPGEYFVTNVRDSDNLLKATPVLVLDTDKLSDELEKDNARVRDAINTVLCSIDKETLLDVNQRGLVKRAIIEAVNECLGITNVVDVLFNDFVMQ
jgi:flagellar basal body-associated protein FliL